MSSTESSSFTEKLKSFLTSGEDWSRLKTTVPGVFVLKMPAYKNSPTRIAVELNPVDSSGSPTKRRGYVLATKEELDQMKELFQYDKLLPLIQSVENVNPSKKKGVAAKPGEEVLEI